MKPKGCRPPGISRILPANASVTSHSRAPHSRAVPGLFWTKIVRPLTPHSRSRGHIRLRPPYGLTRLYTYGLVEWFAGLHGYPVRCPCGHRTGPARESSMFFISYGTRTGPVRDPQGRRTIPLRTRKGIDIARIEKNPARASYLAVRGPYGPLTGPTRAV